MKTPGFDKKRRPLEWNFKNTEVLKKHGILKNLEFFERVFLKMTGFLKGRGS